MKYRKNLSIRSSACKICGIEILAYILPFSFGTVSKFQAIEMGCIWWALEIQLPSTSESGHKIKD